MDKNALISIIVPVYNVEKYIKETLESIIMQTYKNLEIILVDDGSTDKSGEICEKMKKKDPRIKVYHQNNMGVSAARNNGLKNATGDYISFIDSDDILEKDMYEFFLKAIEKYNSDVVICGYNIKNKSGEIEQHYNTGKIKIYNKREAIIDFLEEDIIGSALWNKIYATKTIKNIKFDDKLIRNEDRLFLFESILQCKKIVYIDECKYTYIKRNNSITDIGEIKGLEDMEYVNELIEEKIKTKYPEYEKNARTSTIINKMLVYRIMTKNDYSSKFPEEYKKIKKWIKNQKIISMYKELKKKNLVELIIIKYFNIFYKKYIKYVLENSRLRKHIIRGSL